MIGTRIHNGLGCLLATLLLLASLGSRGASLRAGEGPAGNREASRPVRPSLKSSVTPETVAKLNEELLTLQHQIREERAEALADRRSMQDRIKELKEEERVVRRGLDVLQAEVAKREKEKAERTQKRDENKKVIDELKGPSEKILTACKSFLDRAKDLVETGIPWKVDERKDGIDRVRELISAADATASAALAAAGRVHQEEEALGRLVESGTVEISVGQDAVAVEAFHLGQLAVIFANDDATVIGFAQAGETLEDGLDAVHGNPVAADGYLAAVDILRRRRTPAIIDLFIPSFPVQEEGAESPGGGR